MYRPNAPRDEILVVGELIHPTDAEAKDDPHDRADDKLRHRVERHARAASIAARIAATTWSGCSSVESMVTASGAARSGETR